MGRLALVGLLALLVVDALLVALAFRPDAAGASAVASRRPSAASSSALTPTTAATTSPEASPVSEVIVAVDGQNAWKATLGRCSDKGARLSVTDDGGRSWTDRTSPALALGRVQPVGTQRGFVIGAGANCAAGEYDTTDGARSWRGPRTIDGGWSRVPGGQHPDLVITPKRADARPCVTGPVIDLARVSSTQAVAGCADGRIVGSTDGGATWSPIASVRGTLSLAARGESGIAVVYVARRADGCAGVEVARVTGSSTTRIACVVTSLDGADGRVSLSVVDAGGWLAVADHTWRAAGDLASWSAAA